jgi:hypothetical protein
MRACVRACERTDSGAAKLPTPHPRIVICMTHARLGFACVRCAGGRICGFLCALDAARGTRSHLQRDDARAQLLVYRAALHDRRVQRGLARLQTRLVRRHEAAPTLAVSSYAHYTIFGVGLSLGRCKHNYGVPVQAM